MCDDFKILDYGGTLMCKDTPIADFKMENRKLVFCDVLCEDISKYPGFMQAWGFDTFTFNSFFSTRVIQKNAMYDRDYYNALGLAHYDAESMLKLVNGKNNTDYFWVREDGVGCRTWDEVRKLNKPVVRYDIPEYLLLRKRDVGSGG